MKLSVDERVMLLEELVEQQGRRLAEMERRFESLRSVRRWRRATLLSEGVRMVAEMFDMTPREMRGPRKSQRLADARFVTAYVVREVLRVGFEDIGEELGFKDHSSAVYAYGRGKDLVTTDRRLAVLVDEVMDELEWKRKETHGNRSSSESGGDRGGSEGLLARVRVSERFSADVKRGDGGGEEADVAGD